MSYQRIVVVKSNVGRVDQATDFPSYKIFLFRGRKPCFRLGAFFFRSDLGWVATVNLSKAAPYMTGPTPWVFSFDSHGLEILFLFALKEAYGQSAAFYKGFINLKIFYNSCAHFHKSF